MAVTPAEAARVLDEADLLYSAQDVTRALDGLGQRITARLQDENPLILCVMTGGLVTAGRLLPRLLFPLQVDYLHASRYRGETSGGHQVHWLAMPTTPLEGRAVLLVDDILDEGYTLAAIQAYCRENGAASVSTAVLVEKHHDRRCADAEAEFIGLTVPDRYVFGCGMDYKEYWRNAPGIYAVKGM
ncbi:MAG: hypoxanthine-guanine phosphoribosyltransferase [Gammaproteobacteria bacterium]|jgi:hypoxanthine phosphoribosyltransferase